MSQEYFKQPEEFVLPPSIISRADLSRIVREAEKVDNYMTTISVHEKSGLSDEGVPLVLSEQLTDIMSINNLEFGNSQQRIKLVNWLRKIKDTVPVIHMTFSTTVDQDILRELVGWIRQSVHKHAVISIGLQPSLIGGVYIRTTNQVHDLSVRAQLANSRHLISELVEEINAGR